MKEKYWKNFWKQYRTKDVECEDDLYFQVGKTINRKPIAQECFQWMIQDIAEHLDLQPHDHLLEICCGNGLLTLPLSHHVSFVYAFDFTENLIDAAVKYRSRENIAYKVGDAKQDHIKLFNYTGLPSKILMNDSLGYFEPSDLKEMIQRLKIHARLFYLTGVPCDGLKWNFYNTPERVRRYEELLRTQDKYNDGMGRWWGIDEFKNISHGCGVECSVWCQPPEISTYRINVLFHLDSGCSNMKIRSEIP